MGGAAKHQCWALQRLYSRPVCRSLRCVRLQRHTMLQLVLACARCMLMACHGFLLVPRRRKQSRAYCDLACYSWLALMLQLMRAHMSFPRCSYRLEATKRVLLHTAVAVAHWWPVTWMGTR